MISNEMLSILNIENHTHIALKIISTPPGQDSWVGRRDLGKFLDKERGLPAHCGKVSDLGFSLGCEYSNILDLEPHYGNGTWSSCSMFHVPRASCSIDATTESRVNESAAKITSDNI